MEKLIEIYYLVDQVLSVAMVAGFVGMYWIGIRAIKRTTLKANV